MGLISIPSAGSLIGGNIVAILARTAIRTRAMVAAARFAAKRQDLLYQSFVDQSEYVPVKAEIVSIPIDVRTQETISYSGELTRFALESGAQLTDHMLIQPLVVNVAFEISNFNRENTMFSFALLEEAFLKRQAVELVTEYKTLENMVMTSLDADTSAPFWGKLACRATFQQVKYFTMESTAVTVTAETPKPASIAEPEGLGTVPDSNTSALKQSSNILSGTAQQP
jgi:hypothetical protein